MSDTKKDKVINADNKVCAILHAFTSCIWMLVVGLKIFGIVKYGDPVGVSLISSIGMAICFGCISISYFCKYKKEKSENGGE